MAAKDSFRHVRPRLRRLARLVRLDTASSEPVDTAKPDLAGEEDGQRAGSTAAAPRWSTEVPDSDASRAGDAPSPADSAGPTSRFPSRIRDAALQRLRQPTRATLAGLALIGIVIVALVTVAIRSGGGDTSSKPAAATPPPPDRPIVKRSFLEQVIPDRNGAALPGAGAPQQIAAVVKAMPTGDKVAQLLLLGYEGNGITANLPPALQGRELGGIVIRRPNYSSPEQITSLAGRVTLAARHAHQYPPFIWAPQEGGDVRALPDQQPADLPGDADTTGTAARESLVAGRELSKLNLNGVLAPVIDVGTEERADALGSRAFSSNASATAKFAALTIAAYKRAGIVSAAEHFPGLGAATQAPEDGIASVGLSLAQLRKRDLVPFATAIRAGVPAIVVSNAAYATDDFVTPGTLSHAVSTDLLRGEMGFRGLAIADDLSQPAITVSMSVADAAVQAIAAGCDMVYISGPARGQEAAYNSIVHAVRTCAISRTRLDEAVTRVLTLKREYGLVRGLQPRTRVPAVVPTPGAPTTGVPGATTPVPPSTQPVAPPAP